MKNVVKYFPAIALIITTLVSHPSFAQMKPETPTSTLRVSASTLKLNMRKLWEDHIMWTRNVILCLVDDLPGKDNAVNRLQQNQADIGNTIKPYYGSEAAKKLTELLSTHITISAEVIRAAKVGNTSTFDEANTKWHLNADDIAQFFSAANSNWALADMKKMLDTHLKLTIHEAEQRIKKNYSDDVISYDKVHNQILKMSDMLANGIVKQFPEKFQAQNPRVSAAK